MLYATTEVLDAEWKQIYKEPTRKLTDIVFREHLDILIANSVEDRFDRAP